MQIYTVSFFGHRDFSKHFEYEEKIKQIITNLLREKEYVEFLVGRSGEFDLFVASVIRRVRNEHGCNNCALTLVLPYVTAEYRDNEEGFLNYYDEIEICPDSEKAHFKSAITVRNKSIIDRSDLVIFYVERENGGAYNSLKYAENNRKNIINIAD